MMPSQKRALSDIAACCTQELGGRLYRCDDCHDTFWHFYCCRNRACPKCHGSQTREWLEAREAELLPCDYFHAVVTVPSQLRAAFRRHQKSMYGLLMQVSADAVKELCAEKRHLGALPGILSVLHTWNGQLGYHPHVHMLITGGGITHDGRPLGRIGPTDRTPGSNHPRHGRRRRNQCMVPSLRQHPDEAPRRVPSFRRAVAIRPR